MKREFSWIRFTMIWVVLTALTAMSADATESGDSFATMTSAGTTLYWTTAQTGAELSLSVTGPAFAMQRISGSGESPSLTLAAADGSPLVDGIYNWEIRESFPGVNDGVSDPINGRDADTAQSAQRRVPIQGRVESGVFTIKNGLVIDSAISEEDAQNVESASDKEGD